MKIKEQYMDQPCRLVDRRQRAYRNLDVCQADGEWVEESQYNRNGKKKVLVGNWQEEQVIEEEVPSKERVGPPHLSTSGEDISFKRPKCSATVATGIDGKLRTVFADWQQPKPKELPPTTLLIKGDDSDFQKSLKTKKFEAPQIPREEDSVGRRKKLEEAKLLAQAAAELDALEAMKNETFKKVMTEETFKTTYKVDLGKENNPTPSLDLSFAHTKANPSFTYVHDMPVTIYSESVLNKNPIKEKLSTHVYHSPVNPLGHSFAKNTTFSKPIYEYKDGPTKE